MSHAVTVIYISNADSEEISVLRLHAERGDLTLIQTLPLGGQVMPMAVSPDRRFLYAALRSPPYRIASLRIDASQGTLAPIGTSPLPDSMASIAVDRVGGTLFAASYGGHQVSVSPIGRDGVAGPATQVVPTGMNAHAVLPDPSNRWLFVTNLGADQVMQLRFDAAARRVAANTPASMATRAGAGPRHLVFHPNGRFVYLLNELDANVDVLGFDARQGTLAVRQTLSTVPPGFTGRSWAADLHLTPDGRFLYTSERTSSTLTAFAVDPATGALKLRSYTATETQPRGFNIDPSGRWLVAVGQQSNALTLYAIDSNSGALTARHRHALGRNPNWVEIVALS